jgi:hypothetical protein
MRFMAQRFSLSSPTGGRAARGANRALLRAACVALLLLVFAQASSAIPLSTYHQRVRAAIALIGQLLQGEAAQTDVRQREKSSTPSALAEVRKSLAAEETVEWNGTILHVDNNWLGDALDKYERLSAADKRRFERLSRIAERLRALDERLSEMEAQPAKAVDKEAEKARLAAILRRPEFNKPSEEGNALSRLLKRIRDWLRSLFPKEGPGKEPRQDSRAVNNGAQVIVSMLSLAVILYVAWRFLPRFLRRDLKKREKRRRGPRVVLGEQLTAEQTSNDLLMEAERLARAGDIRGAIRRGYIALLCELHDRRLLRLEQHKTNRDYLRAVEANRPLYDEMKPMTMSFESHWYGLNPAHENDWQDFRAHYRQALKQ